MSPVKLSTKQNLFFKINLLLIAAGLFAIAEARLPARDVTSPVRVVKEHGYTGQGGAVRSWSAVIMEDGSYIWTQRTTDRFTPMDSFDMHVTPILGSVVNYRKHGTLYSWMEVEREEDRYRPFPYVVVLVGLLLMLPFWSADSRLFLQGVLLVVSATWALTLVTTGGYVFKLMAQLGW